MKVHDAESGFGLVETLIAAAIIAAVAALAFSSIAQNAQSTRMISERRAAILVARSQLDAAIATNAGEASQDGLSDGLRWRIDIVPYTPRQGTAPALERVTVTVARADTGGALVRLRSLRIAQ